MRVAGWIGSGVLAVLLTAPAVAAAPGNMAANWDCAAPLVARSAAEPVSAMRIAYRISDQCAAPFQVPADQAATDADAQARHRTMYELDLRLFTMAVNDAVLRARRPR